jgi:hypothetical protein
MCASLQVCVVKWREGTGSDDEGLWWRDRRAPWLTAMGEYALVSVGLRQGDAGQQWYVELERSLPHDQLQALANATGVAFGMHVSGCVRASMRASVRPCVRACVRAFLLILEVPGPKGALFAFVCCVLMHSCIMDAVQHQRVLAPTCTFVAGACAAVTPQAPRKCVKVLRCMRQGA